jgi:hypothetical protein
MEGIVNPDAEWQIFTRYTGLQAADNNCGIWYERENISLKHSVSFLQLLFLKKYFTNFVFVCICDSGQYI